MNVTERSVGYEEDFYEWSQRQARLLSEGRFEEADIPNIREEIESLGRSDLRSVVSLTLRILQHLTYLGFSPAKLPRAHWEAEIVSFRGQLVDQLKDSPSLRTKLAASFDDAWRRARKIALRTLQEVDKVTDLPVECPFTLEQVLDEDYFPEPASRSA